MVGDLGPHSPQFRKVHAEETSLHSGLSQAAPASSECLCKGAGVLWAEPAGCLRHMEMINWQFLPRSANPIVGTTIQIKWLTAFSLVFIASVTFLVIMTFCFYHSHSTWEHPFSPLSLLPWPICSSDYHLVQKVLSGKPKVWQLSTGLFVPHHPVCMPYHPAWLKA